MLHINNNKYSFMDGSHCNYHIVIIHTTFQAFMSDSVGTFFRDQL
jgi:uncharacterized protein YaaW (UPF0174 family)